MAPAGRVTAVLWDFGGVLTTSPFEAFRAYEVDNHLPPGFIRGLNATNPDTNAWARLERGELEMDRFCAAFEEEAAQAGGSLDARAVMAGLRGDLRPAMVEALRRCHATLKTGLLTNNFAPNDSDGEAPFRHHAVLGYFDAVVESSRAGCRKPDIRFYELACELLQIDPSDAVFLDDLGVNLKPARAMGMRTIKVEDPDEALRQLQAIVGFPLRSATRAHVSPGRPARARAWRGYL